METTPQRRITARDLIGLRLPGDVSVSPDGTRLVFTEAEVDFDHGEHIVQLFLAPDPNPDPNPDPDPGSAGKGATAGSAAQPPPPVRQLTHGICPVQDPAWSPDGRSIAFITFRPQPHEDDDDDQREDGSDKDQVFLLPAAGGEARRLTEAAEGVEMFRWAADGAGLYFAGHAPRPAAERSWRRRRRDAKDDGLVVHRDVPAWEIWYQPLDGGRARRLFGGFRGLEDFDVAPDGKLLAYSTNHTGLSADDDRTEIIVRELESGTERRLTGGRGGMEVAPMFTRDGRFLLFHGWNDPGLAYSRQELFAVDLAAEPGSPVAAPRALLSPVDRDVEEFEVLPDGRVAVLVGDGLESRLLVVDPATGRIERTPLAGCALSRLAVARDSGRLAAVVETPDRLPEVCWIDPETGATERLTDLNPDAADWRRATRRRVRWTNEGFEHEGLLLIPHEVDRLPGPRPPVLMWLHGGPHWRVVDTLRTYEAEALASEGWAVFLPNYRGSSGYGERYQTAIRGDLGGAEVRDLLVGLDAIADEVDLARAAVGGASYGGYLTNWLLATTDRFRAGVSIAGIFDLGQDFSTSEYGSWEEHYLGGTPWEKADLYRERSPITHAAGITAPLLILHGLEDENTLVTNGKALYRALARLGRTVEFVVYPREGHGLAEPAHRVDECERILEWFGQHVLGGTAPRLAGREVKNGAASLTLLSHQARRDYNGVRPAEGRIFFEISVLVRAFEGGPDVLRLVPSGPSSDIVLIDRHGDLYRPMGIPVEVHGQQMLFLGGGLFEAWKGEDGRPPSLPATSIFELPDRAATYRLRVQDLPPVQVRVPEPDEDPATVDEAAQAKTEDSVARDMDRRTR